MLTKVIIVQIILLAFQIVMYFGCEKFQHNMHDVKRPIDDKIPFLPFTALPYSLWFPLIALFPLAVCFADFGYYWIYMSVMFLEIVISVICYMIYPTTFERPVPPDTFFGNAMKIIYKGSYRGLNCAPSLHCSSCYLIMYVAILCPNLPLVIKLVAVIVAVMIVISTMTTKQHTVIDVVSAFVLFVVCLLLGKLVPVSLMEALAVYIGA